MKSLQKNGYTFLHCNIKREIVNVPENDALKIESKDCTFARRYLN